MANPFHSEHLIYKGIDVHSDEYIFLTIRQDPIAFVQADDEILVPQTRQNVLEMLNRFVATSLMSVIICLPASQSSVDPVPIGWIRLKSEGSVRRHHRRSEIGISLAEPYRNQGYGSEAIRWILNWGFNSAGLHRIGIKTFDYNDGARRLYERLGFMREGLARESVLHDGKWCGEFEFSMLEQEWRAMENKEKSANASMPTASS